MLPTDLENYLITCRNQHLPFEAVAQKLSQAGYSADLLLSAKTWYLGNSSLPAVEPTTKINNTVFFSTPAEISHYPSNRLNPFIWIVLFLGLSLLTFFILTR